jgi:hypothetical protein
VLEYLHNQLNDRNFPVPSSLYVLQGTCAWRCGAKFVLLCFKGSAEYDFSKIVFVEFIHQ